MGSLGEIAEFNASDGLTPLQVRKLNMNFGNIAKRLPRESIITVSRTETLSPGQDAYVVDEGTPPISELVFGVPKGEKGDQGDKGDKGDPGDASSLIHVDPNEPSPRGTKVLWYDTDDGSLWVWQLDSTVTPATWKWVKVK